MNRKQIGIIIAIVGLLIAGFTISSKVKEDFYIEKLIDQQGGVCVLEDGYCLHADRSWTLYIIGGIASATSILLGLFMIFFDKTDKLISTQKAVLKKELSSVKEKDEFNAFLSGFDDDHKKVLKAVNDQEGILQSTLRYRTGISKSSLSLILGDLEKRGFVNRVKSGKTNKVFMKKVF